MATIVTAATGKEAQEKFKDYQHYASTEAALVLFSGWTGIDFWASIRRNRFVT